jgi:hypothetical protein
MTPSVSAKMQKIILRERITGFLLNKVAAINNPSELYSASVTNLLQHSEKRIKTTKVAATALSD